MEKILYHGSEHIIEKPEWGKGALTNDYGGGFYCTEHAEPAMEWACAKNVNGYANQYALDMTGLSVLNLNSKEYNILNWLALLAEHRTYWEKSSISEQAKKMIRDKEARREYRKSKKQAADMNDIYMLDIMREGMTNGDQRLQ